MKSPATGGGEGWAEFTVFTHYFGSAIALGTISALFSFMRSEAPRFLPVIGFALCAAPVLWFIFHVI